MQDAARAERGVACALIGNHTLSLRVYQKYIEVNIYGALLMEVVALFNLVSLFYILFICASYFVFRYSQRPSREEEGARSDPPFPEEEATTEEEEESIGTTLDRNSGYMAHVSALDTYTSYGAFDDEQQARSGDGAAIPMPIHSDADLEKYDVRLWNKAEAYIPTDKATYVNNNLARNPHWGANTFWKDVHSTGGSVEECAKACAENNNSMHLRDSKYGDCTYFKIMDGACYLSNSLKASTIREKAGLTPGTYGYMLYRPYHVNNQE